MSHRVLGGRVPGCRQSVDDHLDPGGLVAVEVYERSEELPGATGWRAARAGQQLRAQCRRLQGQFELQLPQLAIAEAIDAERPGKLERWPGATGIAGCR